MKKRILLSILAVCGYIGIVSAQEYEYVPLVREGVEWGYMDRSALSSNYFYSYRIEGDTLIDGIAYKKCHRNESCQEESFVMAWLREEGKRVYMLPNMEKWNTVFHGEGGRFPQEQKELIIYDFTPEQVGDIIRYHDFTGDIEEYPIQEVDWVLIDGKLRRRYVFNNSNSSYTYIDGIGGLNLSHLLDPFKWVADAFNYLYSELSYVKRDDGVYEYIEEKHDNPCLEGSVEDVLSPALQVVAQGEQWVITLPSDDCRMIEVIDTTGRVAWCEYLDDNTDRVIIPTSAFGKAIYIVALTAQKGERITCKVAL